MVNFLFLIIFWLTLPLIGNEPVHLKIGTRTIRVNGKEATVFGVMQPDGKLGLQAEKGELFNVLLENSLEVPTSVHWHGVLLPPEQDGVAFITQYPIIFPFNHPRVSTMHSFVNRKPHKQGPTSQM